MLTRPPTEFPLRSLIVDTRVASQFTLHPSETFSRLPDAAVLFKHVTDRLIDEKPRKLKLNRKERQYRAPDYP